MKRLITAGFLSFVALTTIAQLDFPVTAVEKVIGKNYKTNKDVKATEYFFPGRIVQSSFDTESEILKLQVRGTSRNGKRLNNTRTVAIFDLANKKLIWNRKIDLELLLKGVDQEGNVILYFFSPFWCRLNIETGADQWETTNLLQYINSGRGIGIGSKSHSRNILEGIDLKTGNQVWKNKERRLYSVINNFHLNDSVIVVTDGGGLHSIDLRDGSGWDYHTTTLATDYAGQLITLGVAIGLDIAFSLITRTQVSFPFSALGYTNNIWYLFSNVLVDSRNIYFASSYEIARLSHDGQVKWKTPLPEKSVSGSSIFTRDNLLYMVNTGYARLSYGGSFYYDQVRCGTPFIAAFDIDSGKQLILSMLDRKTGRINDFKIHGDTLILVHNDRVTCYSMIHGLSITEKLFDTVTTGALSGFANNRSYYRSDSVFTSIESTGMNKFYVSTQSGKTLLINEQLDILYTIDRSSLYIDYHEANGYKFLSRGEETIVIDNHNKEVAEIDASINSRPIGTRLYDIKDKSFIQIDINQLIQ